MNMDMTIYVGKILSDNLLKEANKVKNVILEIMMEGDAASDF